MKQLRINPVRDVVFAAIHSDSRVESLQEFFHRGAQIYVVAGALRDAVAANMGEYGSNAPRDFDIAVANIQREVFDEILQSQGRQNRHGGYVLKQIAAPHWDVWRMEESIGFRKTETQCSLENLLRTFNLDCNAIALDLRTGLFLDAGAIAAIHHRQVDFVEDVIHHSHETFAAKALLLHLRLNYQLTDRMKYFVSRHLENASLMHEAQKIFPGLIVPPMNQRSSFID